MSNEITVSAIQTSLVWENKKENLKNFEDKISTLSTSTDLIVLPEMFSTGFTMNPKNVAENMNDESVTWMKNIATKNNIAIVGSLVIEESNNYYNRCVFVHPNGTIETYDKRHAFTLAGEDKEYTSGDEKLIVDFKGWKICTLICYDLRFPVWSRNVEGYDLLIYMANWPKPRINAWDALLKARAIENMSYVVGVNRIGVDENEYVYSGHSKMIDSLGNVLIDLEENEEGIITATFSKSTQNEVRKKLNFLNDKDKFTIH